MELTHKPLCAQRVTDGPRAAADGWPEVRGKQERAEKWKHKDGGTDGKPDGADRINRLDLQMPHNQLHSSSIAVHSMPATKIQWPTTERSTVNRKVNRDNPNTTTNKRRPSVRPGRYWSAS